MCVEITIDGIALAIGLYALCTLDWNECTQATINADALIATYVKNLPKPSKALITTANMDCQLW